MRATLWIDVEDLFAWAQNNARPTGIQRLSFEICRTLQELYGDIGLVRFVRHGLDHNSFRIIFWSDVEALFIDLTSSKQGPTVWHFIQKQILRLPKSVGVPTMDLVLALSDVLRAGRQLYRVLARGIAIRLLACGPVRVSCKLARHLNRTIHNGAGVPADDFYNFVNSGDILLALGAIWQYPNYAALVQTHRQRLGLRFGLLVYDLIPLRHPEWCDLGLVNIFRTWAESILPLCDFVFAISRATALDVETYAQEQGIILPRHVIPIPIGSGFSTKLPLGPVPRPSRLPAPGSYALFVSSIEPRKNHQLLFRVWRRMLNDLVHNRVPTLVFAGRRGSGVDDLMQQITNTNNLDGKLVLIENPTDSELAALYQGCLFTLFPSFAEGWGLPVTESLSFGKPCLISNSTSLPEAGGQLVQSFDPNNLNDAYAVIRNVVEDRAGLTQWEARIVRDFKPVPWSTTVNALLAGLGQPMPAWLVANAANISVADAKSCTPP